MRKLGLLSETPFPDELSYSGSNRDLFDGDRETSFYLRINQNSHYRRALVGRRFNGRELKKVVTFKQYVVLSKRASSQVLQVIV